MTRLVLQTVVTCPIGQQTAKTVAHMIQRPTSRVHGLHFMLQKQLLQTNHSRTAHTVQHIRADQAGTSIQPGVTLCFVGDPTIGPKSTAPLHWRYVELLAVG